MRTSNTEYVLRFTAIIVYINNEFGAF